MSYKKPNITGPRVKKKLTHIMSELELKYFKNKHPEYKDLKLSEFNNVIKKFNHNIINEVIENRNGVALPERIGQFIIMSFSKAQHKKIIDFGESNKTGILSYHKNWETDRRIGKIVFQNTSYNYAIKNYKFWGFKATRTFKSNMSKIFKKKWAKYIYIDNKETRISTVLKNK
jgi:hypothetical protein|tara:strand:- start:14694 stop:15212 length:519 start_codon:yes stop_codon:yes gene_type:complete